MKSRLILYTGLAADPMRHRGNGLALLLIIINFCANLAVLGKIFPFFFASVSLCVPDTHG